MPVDSPGNLTEVTERTLKLASKPPGEISPKGFQRIGIRVPHVRALVKQGYPFLTKSPSSVINVWDYIWNNTEYYEVAQQAIYYYQHRTLSKAEFTKIKHWIKRCDCWEHSDDLSKIYAQVLEDNPEWILPTLKTWNRARSPWKRRQSIVGLIEYASKRKRILPFNKLIQFVTPLLGDNDYYVQKGIGWTLREIYNVYPAKTLSYIEANLLSLSASAYSASTEKTDKQTKARLNEIRRQHRSS
ncbi:MAG: DNA alkylation repair protein [Gammaproteobacteria bacterium]|nr:DNA alkylation repair protein [Gammaproteobacteria bacterium]